MQLDIKAYITELVGNLVEEFVEMYELNGAELTHEGAGKLVVATELLTQVMNEMIEGN